MVLVWSMDCWRWRLLGIAVIQGVTGAQWNFYPTTSFVQSVATFCTALDVKLGNHLKLQHYIAALELKSEDVDVPGKALQRTKYFQGEATVTSSSLNFSVEKVLGPWSQMSKVQQVWLREETTLANAYHVWCSLDASHLGITQRLQMKVHTDKVYDWFRYVGYLRWAEHIIKHLSSTGKTFVDLGGGSGWLSTLVKAAMPSTHVVFTDVSSVALTEAQETFETNHLMVESLLGDFFEPLDGRRLETIFCYPPQVATNGETASISGRGSPEMALAAPPEQGQEYYLLRFCEELPKLITSNGVAWLGVTWEMLEVTIRDCCIKGWNVTIPETLRHEVDLPAVLLELRHFSIPPNGTPVKKHCERHARTLCETCPEWLSRTKRHREEAAKLGHVVAQTKLGIEMMHLAAQSLRAQEKQQAVQQQQEAIRWYRRAAKSGEPVAATRLGFLYLTGDGVKKDQRKGLNLLWEAALQGEASAMFGLAETFALSSTRAAEEKHMVNAALKWYRRSAAKGWIEAQRQLGLFLLSRGMMHQEAKEMLSEAAKEGDTKASQLLKDYFSTEL